MAKPAVYRKRRSTGLCGECGEVETGPTRARCTNCREHMNALRRDNWPLRPLAVREKQAAVMRKYYAAHKDTWRAWSYKKKYGMTIEDYDRLLAKQHGGCAICKATIGEPKRQRRLFVDHDHKTKIVRGLLCGRCNTAIGYLRDHPAYAHALLGYLMSWKS
jgi:hypothetical protein